MFKKIRYVTIHNYKEMDSSFEYVNPTKVVDDVGYLNLYQYAMRALKGYIVPISSLKYDEDVSVDDIHKSASQSENQKSEAKDELNQADDELELYEAAMDAGSIHHDIDPTVENEKSTDLPDKSEPASSEATKD
ncbi:hypothetical protein [Jodiemicrovirus-1]|nr:hypothetical protein [Jodiemicrovirus-1]